MIHDDGAAEREERLGALREEIAGCDREILALVARRIRFSEEIARLKQSLDLPLRDSRIEGEVIARMERACRALGIDPGLGRSLAEMIIRASIDIQSRRMQERENQEEGRRRC